MCVYTYQLVEDDLNEDMMYIYIYVYLCMHVCMHVCMHACMHPTQSIMHVSFLVARFQQRSFLIIQYKYLNIVRAEDQIL